MHNQLGGVCLSNVYTNIPWDSIHKFSSLVRYYPLRPAVTTKEREQEICHTHCSFIRQWSSFRPLGEVVSGRDDVLVSPRCLSQWTYSMHHEKHACCYTIIHIIWNILIRSIPICFQTSVTGIGCNSSASRRLLTRWHVSHGLQHSDTSFAIPFHQYVESCRKIATMKNCLRI